MNNSHYNFKSPQRLQTGFTLIEVMVAFLILAIGLLGSAYLQTRSVQFGNESQNRSQVNIVVSEMIDRMRSNMIQSTNAASSIYTSDITGTELIVFDYEACSEPVFPITTSIRKDVVCFYRSLENLIPSSNILISREDLDKDGNKDSYEVTVYWSDQQLSQGNLDPNKSEGKIEEIDCAGVNRTWSNDITWPDSARTLSDVCLISHSWQFEVPVR
jgi:type IV pilus assembly protein PilV